MAVDLNIFKNFIYKKFEIDVKNNLNNLFVFHNLLLTFYYLFKLILRIFITFTNIYLFLLYIVLLIKKGLIKKLQALFNWSSYVKPD